MSRAGMSLHPPSSPEQFPFVTASKGVAFERDLGRDGGRRRWPAGTMLLQHKAAALSQLYIFPPIQPSSPVPTMLLYFPSHHHPGKAPLAFAELTKAIRSRREGAVSAAEPMLEEL